MGFSGGGSNVLLPHTHDGTVAQDGGPLDFNNITQQVKFFTRMEFTYSSSHIQAFLQVKHLLR